MVFWEQLKRAREQAGLSLEALAARTKIRPSVLAAVERGDLASIGPPFYVRALIRAYAAEVGVEAEPILRDYAESFAPRPSPSPSPPASLPVRSNYTFTLLPPRWNRLGPAVMVGLAGILLILAFSVSRPKELAPFMPDAGLGAAGTSGTAVPVVAPPHPENGENLPAVDSTDLNKTGSLTLEVRPTRLLWLDAAVDGKRTVYKLLQPGETVVLEARSGMQIRIGDAGALDYSVNGHPGRRLGRPGQVRTVDLTPDNYRDFLQSPPD